MVVWFFNLLIEFLGGIICLFILDELFWKLFDISMRFVNPPLGIKRSSEKHQYKIVQVKHSKNIIKILLNYFFWKVMK